MIRIYQDRMTDMCMEKDKVIAEMQEKEQRVMARDAEQENWRLERRVRYADQDIESAAQVTPPTYANAPRQSSPVHVASSLPAHTFEPMGSPRRRYDVDIAATPPPVSGIPAMDARNHHYEIPLPRQLVFDGKNVLG